MAPRYRRLTKPLVRVDGELRGASWDEALDRPATTLKRGAG
jgi:predicted molibdopterin-dependent oxidoreductase YjgC